MQLEDLKISVTPVPGAMPVWRGEINATEWRTISAAVHDKGGRLIALWGSDHREDGRGFAVHATMSIHAGLLWLTLPLAAEQPEYPDLAAIFPAASRMQRAAYDMLGITATGSADQRPWLRHAAWPQNQFPLRKDFAHDRHFTNEQENYPFVPVRGEGVHEIPVGPVHAGIIEPGHFHFSIVGERVLRLEQRLGYTHKGIEKRFEGMTLREGATLAGRISGDSTVAYAWAYAMAAEGATGATPPPRGQWLRALLLERERIANHLGDLGALGNDAALAFGLAQFSRLKEDWLRTNHTLFGHRYLMDAIIPGGVARDLNATGIARIREEVTTLKQEVALLKNIYDEHAGLQDRFITAGRVAPELAARLGLCGLAGRASGMAWDLRVEFPLPPYDRFEVNMATHRNGDVAARVIVRFEEIFESLRLLDLILDGIPVGETSAALGATQQPFGLGWVEGWRGEVLIALETGPDQRIHRLHPHDPSWQNWPLLEHAVMDNIVPDFPLINKSFNLSYSGQDL